jgi:riboflavin biosynthesis pyrimidine reductase
VSLGSVSSAGSSISGRNPADRFLMGLLRACADAVLVGAGTLRATPGHRWTPEHIFPEMAGAFEDLRHRLRRQPRPRLVLFTVSGDLDVEHPALLEGATVVTNVVGAARLQNRLPGSSDVVVADVQQAIPELHRRGFKTLLTEGGPRLIGELIKADALNEAFITVSPVIAGRDREERLGMVAGAELLPSRGLWSRLVSVRRHHDFLFLRYDLRKSASP